MPSFIRTLPLLAVFFVLNSLSTSLLAIEISVSPDRNPVNLNESLQITFSANGEPDAEPDFSPLEKDFTILNKAQQQSTQIINWKKTKSFQWILSVMPKRSGNLLIPAINFGKDASQFSSLIVHKEAAASSVNDDLFLQVEVSNTQPYIQEQVIYTLKLYRKVNISQASLTEPELQNAVIEKLGKDKNYNTQHQGENYAVTERKYAIFPQKSGVMNIAPLTLTANIIVASQRRSNSFFNRQSTRTKRVASEEITLEVQPKPGNIAAENWLPVQQLYLQEKWPDNSTEMTVGEPITRSITLFVEGATVGSLPELYKKNMPAHLKAYPDQPVLKSEGREAGMVALREEKIALIPGQAGTYILPAIEVHWWNTRTRQAEVARIPERTISAVAALDSADKQINQTPAIAPAPAATAQAEGKSTLNQQENVLWFWLSLFFASAWVLTLIYFLSRKSRVTDNKPQQLSSEKVLAVNKALKQACKENDPAMAKDVLLQWGRENFKQSSLSKIAQQCDQSLQDEILLLNTVLYANNTEDWQGSNLWAAFQSNKAGYSEKSAPLDPLQPLFKI
ncbi:MAG: protein BatD [Methyloprofundus sp.]|nr:protein BatD [Methyloprofundus sp.]